MPTPNYNFDPFFESYQQTTFQPSNTTEYIPYTRTPDDAVNQYYGNQGISNIQALESNEEYNAFTKYITDSLRNAHSTGQLDQKIFDYLTWLDSKTGKQMYSSLGSANNITATPDQLEEMINFYS